MCAQVLEWTQTMLQPCVCTLADMTCVRHVRAGAGVDADDAGGGRGLLWQPVGHAARRAQAPVRSLLCRLPLCKSAGASCSNPICHLLHILELGTIGEPDMI